MLAEDLAALAAAGVMFLAVAIGTIVIYRRRHMRAGAPLTADEAELQLERELEAVNRQIENLREPEV